MKDTMKVYLDNCCFNRPFDNQSSLVIRLETEAKLHIQELIRQGKLQLLWSFVLDYENGANPFEEVRNRIAEWKKLAFADCNLSDKIIDKARALMRLGLRQMDASHIACAIHLDTDCFLTTDKRVLNKHITEIEIINPLDFIRRYPDAD
ncbi:MAG: PIN domain-containing protein [Synergistaceae bacterium]|nr:PIN domain-containing protein [Synergistaceae bacterium]